MPSAIEWTQETWNPVAGCTKVSTGCANCYAESMSVRLAGMARADRKKGKDPGRKANYLDVVADGRWTGRMVCDETALNIPLHWKNPRRIFVNSMSDLFHEGVPFEFIDKVFAMMALCPQHTFQVLTKRPERAAEYLQTLAEAGSDAQIIEHLEYALSETGAPDDGIPMGGTRWPLHNVHLGTSVENQATADERIPHLLRCPAAVRWLSCEPLLGRIDLGVVGCHAVGVNIYKFPIWIVGGGGGSPVEYKSRIDWVVVGGESGPGARPCNPDWIRSLRDQCRAADVPFFFKQWGRWYPGSNKAPVPCELPYERAVWDGSECYYPVGKKAAGRVLDGRTWDEMP